MSEFTAYWCEPGLPLLHRHRCGFHCQHGLLQSHDWVTSAGALLQKGALETPDDGFVINLFTSEERYFSNRAGGLSLKTLISGGEQFEIGGGLHRIEPGQALVVNPDQEYASLLHPGISQNLCVTYGNRLVSQARWAGLAEPAEVLDQTITTASIPLFLEKVYGHDSGFDRFLTSLLQSAAENDKALLEESGLSLLEYLLFQNTRAWAESANLGIQSLAAQQEAQQRLHRARDFMEATWDEKYQLEDWAKVACMSRFHFLRLFKAAFEETPRQYLIRRRLERAADKILNGHESLLQVALSCGFESASHFSRAFKKQFGTTPQQWAGRQL